MHNDVVSMVRRDESMQVTIEQIQQAAAHWSIEVTPAGATKIDSFADCLDPGTTVNVTFCLAVTRWIRLRSPSACIMRA